MGRKDPEQPFSKRCGHAPADPEITTWEDAPEGFRFLVLSVAKTDCGLRPSTLRDIVCRVLRVAPNPSNWSEHPNIWDEIRGQVDSCDWYRVYDIAAAIGSYLRESNRWEYPKFEKAINDCLCEMGIGWQLKDGMVQTRSDTASEAMLEQTLTAMQSVGITTAQSELDEAVRDLSRRPQPDLSGAIQHATAAMECVARRVAGDSKSTLGELIKRHPTLLPKPLDDAVIKAWGYASEQARHGREHRQLSRAEAQLVVGVTVAVSAYLLQKMAVTGDGVAAE